MQKDDDQDKNDQSLITSLSSDKENTVGGKELLLSIQSKPTESNDNGPSDNDNNANTATTEGDIPDANVVST